MVVFLLLVLIICLVPASRLFSAMAGALIGAALALAVCVLLVRWLTSL